MLDVISMNFVQCIDPGLFDIAFAGILSGMEALKNHRIPFDTIENKKGKRCPLFLST